MWGCTFDASVTDRQASEGSEGGFEFTQTLPRSHTSPQGRPSARNCLSLQIPEPWASQEKGPAGTCSEPLLQQALCNSSFFSPLVPLLAGD